jgi:predicted enzyme related to lactoylglutathione lyase
MEFASVRIITDDLDRLVGFYETVTGVTAQRLNPVFAETVMPSCTLAIGHSETVPLCGEGVARAADNHTVIIEFRVADVDAEHARLTPLIEDWVQAPTTMPGGTARSCSVIPTATSSTCSPR